MKWQLVGQPTITPIGKTGRFLWAGVVGGAKTKDDMRVILAEIIAANPHKEMIIALVSMADGKTYSCLGLTPGLSCSHSEEFEMTA